MYIFTIEFISEISFLVFLFLSISELESTITKLYIFKKSPAASGEGFYFNPIQISC